MTAALPEGYGLRQGTSRDRPLLRRIVEASLAEQLGRPPTATAVEMLLTRLYDPRQTPVWWVSRGSEPVACLWLGRSWDYFDGTHSTYVHLLYVHPEHRRRGIGRFLLDWASEIARGHGDSRITLQTLPDNRAALALYGEMGFETRAVFLSKQLKAE